MNCVLLELLPKLVFAQQVCQRLQDSPRRALTGLLGSSEAGSLSAASVASSSLGGQVYPCGQDTSPSEGFTPIHLFNAECQAERLSLPNDSAKDQTPELTVSGRTLLPAPLITQISSSGTWGTAEPS